MPRDRTAEFKQTAQRLLETRAVALPESQVPPPRPSRTKFSQVAAQIALDIQTTSAKLEKLTKLAKTQSLFNDPAVEIAELTVVIKQDLAALNQQIDQLHQYREKAPEIAGTNKQTQSHSQHVVTSLKVQLAEASNEFVDVLNVRTENLKHQTDRRSKYTSNSTVTQRRTGESSLFNPNSQAAATAASQQSSQHGVSEGADVAIDMRGMAAAAGGGGGMQMTMQQDRYLESRANAMQNIQDTIQELGSIFSQLAVMVQEQGEMVERIDDDTQTALLEVESGQQELLRYFNNLKSNRGLMLKMFGVLMLFIVLFLAFR